MNWPNKNYREGLSPFVLCCLLTAVLTLLFVGGNILIIIGRGLQSLPDSLTQPETLFAVRLSVRCSCISTLLCFLLALPTSYVLTRQEVPLRGLIEVVLQLTLSLPYIVLGLSLLILFSSPLGGWLKTAGFPVVFSKNGIVLAQLIVNLPFAIKLSATALRGVDGKLERAAGLLGASPGRRFFTVLLPSCKNTLVSAVVLVWARALGEFGATLMLVGVTRMKTETLPGNIYLNVSTNNLSGALASAFILLLITAASLLLDAAVRRLDRGHSRYGH
ncbi:MAG: ABC transporter permease subunit [Firmicutes bacterium]|nr:ABC transporter permease subunit [Bacillota bacterium]